MNILYFIQCHRGFEQIKMLIASLRLQNGDSVIIHVDAKNQDLLKKLKKTYQNIDVVDVIDDSISVYWSGFSQVHATLKMFRYCHDIGKDFDYCLLLSGEDIVLDVDKMRGYLENKVQKSFIEFRDDHDNYTWRINRFNFFRDNKYSRHVLTRALDKIVVSFQKLLGIKRNNFSDSDIYLGSQWFTLSKKHYDLIYNKIDSDFLRKFRFTSCCDEHLFQILFKKYINDSEYYPYNLRYIKFQSGKSSPEYLTVGDLRKLDDLDHVFIARKVTEDTMRKYFHDLRIE